MITIKLFHLLLNYFPCFFIDNNSLKFHTNLISKSFYLQMENLMYNQI